MFQCYRANLFFGDVVVSCIQRKWKQIPIDKTANAVFEEDKNMKNRTSKIYILSEQYMFSDNHMSSDYLE